MELYFHPHVEYFPTLQYNQVNGYPPFFIRQYKIETAMAQRLIIDVEFYLSNDIYFILNVGGSSSGDQDRLPRAEGWSQSK